MKIIVKIETTEDSDEKIKAEAIIEDRKVVADILSAIILKGKTIESKSQGEVK